MSSARRSDRTVEGLRVCPAIRSEVREKDLGHRSYGMQLTIRRICLALVVASVAPAGCSKSRNSEASAPETVSNVPVVTVQKAEIPDWIEAVGTVRAAQISDVSSQMMGTIIEIRVHEGDRVQAGELLARIDDAQPRSAMDQATAAVTAAGKATIAAETDLALADATLKRYQPLYEKKSISALQFDQTRAQFQSAEARRDMARAAEAQAEAMLAQAQTSLAYTEVRAPFSGVITDKKVDPGALALPGMAIFTLENTGNFRLEATVDESDIGWVQIGQSTVVTLDSLGSAGLSGKVVQIVPAADPASRSFLVKISLPVNKGVRSGLFGRAHFPRGTRQALLIPFTAVVQRGQMQGVYALDANQIAGLRYITLGRRDADKVEVLSGLQNGEKLVAAPAELDLSGKRIAARP